MCASLQVALQGIPGIRKVFIREAKRVIPDEAAPDGYANETEWMLDTEGVNLLEARARMGTCQLLAARCLAVASCLPSALRYFHICAAAVEWEGALKSDSATLALPHMCPQVCLRMCTVQPCKARSWSPAPHHRQHGPAGAESPTPYP